MSVTKYEEMWIVQFMNNGVPSMNIFSTENIAMEFIIRKILKTKYVGYKKYSGDKDDLKKYENCLINSLSMLDNFGDMYISYDTVVENNFRLLPKDNIIEIARSVVGLDMFEQKKYSDHLVLVL